MRFGAKWGLGMLCVLMVIGCGGTVSSVKQVLHPASGQFTGSFSAESGGLPWIIGDFDLTVSGDLSINGSGSLAGIPHVAFSGMISESGFATITLTDLGVNPNDPITMTGQLYETATGGKGVLFHGVSDLDPRGIPQDFELELQ
ncbi:MAG: hypothetical protein ACKVQS_11320 [Fimbriimonadaceae bacterium]